MMKNNKCIMKVFNRDTNEVHEEIIDCPRSYPGPLTVTENQQVSPAND